MGYRLRVLFLSLVAFVLFIILHTALVLLVYFPDNIRNIVFGQERGSVLVAALIAVLALALVVAIYIWTSWYTLRHKRRVQHALSTVVDPVVTTLLERETSRQQLPQSSITSYFWVNGRPPESEEYREMAQFGFANWRLEVRGLVEQPLSLSLADLHALSEQSQITRHNCIQGWSGIAEWTGVCVSDILARCKPLPDARYIVCTSYSLDDWNRPFYEVIDLLLAKHPQTILAYAMNGQPLPIVHGAPLRLRVETLLGYKMVKYLHAIELVAEYETIGAGLGGSREDIRYYGRGAEI